LFKCGLGYTNRGSGIHPTQKATGEFAEESFRSDINRLGGFKNVKALLIDQGRDLTKGLNYYERQRKN